MEFTCIKCEFKFHETNMDTDERMCYDCLDEDETEPTTDDEYNKRALLFEDKYPPETNLIKQRVSREDYKIGWKESDKTGEPVGSQPSPAWDCEKGCYILPMNRRIEVEITYEGEEE